MMASTTTIATVTATLAPKGQSRMSSQIVTARSAQRAEELRGNAKKGSALSGQTVDGYRCIGLDRGALHPKRYEVGLGEE